MAKCVFKEVITTYFVGWFVVHCQRRAGLPAILPKDGH
jgi:hypothetical protein